MTETHQFVRWALKAKITDVPASIGVAKVQLVLTCLAAYADRDGLAFPAQQTIADEIYGLARRDVRNALAVLEKAGLIVPSNSKRRGRVTEYQLQYVDESASDMAGYPAHSATDEITHKAGYPANPQGGIPRPLGSDQLAGNMAGQLAGHLAGYPAPNGIEEKKYPPAPQTKRPVSAGSAAQRAGRDEQAIEMLMNYHQLSRPEASAVVEIAKSDTTTTTSWAGRLKQPGYVEQCRNAVKAQRHRDFAAQPECEEHTGEIGANCRSCRADIKAGQRSPAYLGRRQP